MLELFHVMYVGVDYWDDAQPTHTRTHTHAHTHTHTHMHACTHARTHAHTYTHTCIHNDNNNNIQLSFSLQDSNLTWNSSWPQFTDCFQKTALIGGPCALLWLVSSFYVWQLLQAGNSPLPSTRLSSLKMVTLPFLPHSR